MTTIAYKDGVMASDSCMSGNGVLKGRIVKVGRTSSGALYGFAGEADVREVLALIDRIRGPEELPNKREIAHTQTDFMLLIAFSKNEVYEIGCNECDDGRYQGWVVAANLGFASIGSGDNIALGALAAGASAVDAVMIATEFDCFSKAPVYSIAFDNPPAASKKPAKPKPK